MLALESWCIPEVLVGVPLLSINHLRRSLNQIININVLLKMQTAKIILQGRVKCRSHCTCTRKERVPTQGEIPEEGRYQ